MTRYGTPQIACVVVWAIVGSFVSAAAVRAQVAPATPAEAAARSAAAKASPELVNGLAKEFGSTPEQAAGAAGVLFSLAKSLLPPDDFAAMSKGVPGIDALLAATPAGVPGAAGSTPTRSMLTPGIASSPSGGSMAASDGISSAAAGISNLGIKPEMIMKALPFLSGYLKKYGGAALGSLFERLFKGAGKAGP